MIERLKQYAEFSASITVAGLMYLMSRLPECGLWPDGIDMDMVPFEKTEDFLPTPLDG